MPAKRSAVAVAGDSSDENEMNVNKVVETKIELDKIRKDREKKRTQLQADLDNKLDDLRARVQQSITAHIQQLGGVHQEQVDRLLRVIAARDDILQNISGKLSEIQDEGTDIAEKLDSAYERRLKKAESASMSAERQTGPQTKKAKAGSA